MTFQELIDLLAILRRTSVPEESTELTAERKKQLNEIKNSIDEIFKILSNRNLSNEDITNFKAILSKLIDDFLKNEKIMELSQDDTLLDSLLLDQKELILEEVTKSLQNTKWKERKQLVEKKTKKSSSKRLDVNQRSSVTAHSDQNFSSKQIESASGENNTTNFDPAPKSFEGVTLNQNPASEKPKSNPWSKALLLFGIGTPLTLLILMGLAFVPVVGPLIAGVGLLVAAAVGALGVLICYLGWQISEFKGKNNQPAAKPPARSTLETSRPENNLSATEQLRPQTHVGNGNGSGSDKRILTQLKENPNMPPAEDAQRRSDLTLFLKWLSGLSEKFKGQESISLDFTGMQLNELEQLVTTIVNKLLPETLAAEFNKITNADLRGVFEKILSTENVEALNNPKPGEQQANGMVLTPAPAPLPTNNNTNPDEPSPGTSPGTSHP